MAGSQNKVTVLHSAADILSSLHLLLDFGGVSAHACLSWWKDMGRPTNGLGLNKLSYN